MTPEEPKDWAEDIEFDTYDGLIPAQHYRVLKEVLNGSTSAGSKYDLRRIYGWIIKLLSLARQEGREEAFGLSRAICEKSFSVESSVGRLDGLVEHLQNPDHHSRLCPICGDIKLDNVLQLLSPQAPNKEEL